MRRASRQLRCRISWGAFEARCGRAPSHKSRFDSMPLSTTRRGIALRGLTRRRLHASYAGRIWISMVRSWPIIQQKGRCSSEFARSIFEIRARSRTTPAHVRPDTPKCRPNRTWPVPPPNGAVNEATYFGRNAPALPLGGLCSRVCSTSGGAVEPNYRRSM